MKFRNFTNWFRNLKGFYKVIIGLGAFAGSIGSIYGVYEIVIKIIPPYITGVVEIKTPKWGNFCLGVPDPENDGIEKGANLVVWTCENRNDQKFQFYRDGSIKTAKKWNYCLGIEDPEDNGIRNGDNLVVWTCENRNDQRFKFYKEDGTIRLKEDSDFCLGVADPHNKGPKKGSEVVAWSCDQKDNQIFSLK